jgi:hypothetical protein
MRWLPRNWNDVLALILFLMLPVYWGWLLKAGVPEATINMIVGAGLVWFADVVKFYFRKGPPTAGAGVTP